MTIATLRGKLIELGEIPILGSVKDDDARGLAADDGGQEEVPDVLRARLGAGQITVIFGGMAVSMAAALAAIVALHGYLFMPIVKEEVGGIVDRAITEHLSHGPHNGAVTDGDLKLSLRPLEVEVGNLAQAINRLNDRLDRGGN